MIFTALEKLGSPLIKFAIDCIVNEGFGLCQPICEKHCLKN